MKLSKKKNDALWEAINKPIERERFAVRNSINVLGTKNADDMDALLWRLKRKTWAEVKKALEIEDG